MVGIGAYNKYFEEIYWDVWKSAENKISSGTKNFILSSSRTFLPEDFFEHGNPTFRELILAPFEKLKKAQQYTINTGRFQTMWDACHVQIQAGNDLNNFCKEFVETYKKVADSVKDGVSMRVRIVKNTGLTVCPYCNRNYINSRGEKVSGAQLDHFFEKSNYPLFAVSLYNLVPVCGNCNRVKSSQNMEFASPFDEAIDWDRDVTFSYEPSVEKRAKIIVSSKHPAVQNNIEKMRIEEAYQIHDVDVEELLEKKKMYCKTQRQEFQDVLYKMNLSEQEIKLAVFGPQITRETMRTRPLSKMMSDLHKELEIY